MIEATRNHNLFIPTHTHTSLLPLPLNRHRNLPRGAHGQNPRLGRIDHSCEPFHGRIHAHIANRERPALVLLRLEFPVARALAQVFDGGGNGFQPEGVGAADDGRHEADGRGDGDADVDGGVFPDEDLAVGAFAPGGIDGGHFLAGERDGFDEEVVQGEFVAAVGGGVEGLSELEEFADGEGARDEVVRVLVHGLGQAAGDGFAHRGGGRVFVGCGWGATGCWLGG